jgi:nucleoside-diphosphate-sugar epimerase
VHTSTVGVHGHVEHPPADENAPFAPGDIYQATKAEAETLALDFHRKRGLPVAVVRPGAIYGPGETRFLKLFRAIARSRYAIVGTGRTFYHPVYIDDLVSGFLLALERPEAAGEAFLVCGPSYVSQSDLAALVARHTGGRVLPFRIPSRPIQWAGDLVEAICVPLGLEPPLHRRRVDFWTKSRAFTIDKARRLLGYAPQVDLDEGIRRTAASYREAGWL